MMVAPALRVAAGLLWLVGVGFGISCVPAIRNLIAGRDLPMIMGFRAFGGGPFERLGTKAMVVLLVVGLVVNLIECAAGWLLWRGDKVGGLLAIVLLPVGAVFWWGFALPFPPVFALVRTILIVLNWRTLH
jgi:hypothetical protein